MIDYSRRGKRIHIKRPLSTHMHTFNGSEHGQLLGESDNGLGQKLAYVLWDGGEDFGPVFSDEIEEGQ